MRKRHFGRLLSSALSVALAFTSVIPSYAMEGVDADDLAQAQEDAEAEEEETEEPAEEPVEEVPEELAATPAEEEEEDVLVEEDEDDVLVGETETEWTVTFDVNGGTALQSSTVNVTKGQAVAAPSPAPTKTGYSLSGWYLKTGESEYSSSAYDFDTAVTGDITLRAGWTANSYKVTLNKNCTADVTGLPTPVEDFVGITVTYDGTYSDLPTLTRTGYDFLGWYDAQTSGNKIQTTDTVAITADTTFYAHWTAQEYTVTFTPGEGASVDPTSKTVAYDGKYGELPTPVKEGFTFGGWYDSADTSYESEITSDTDVAITANQTLIAKWTETSTPAEKVVITVKKIVGDAAAVDFGTVEVDKDSAIKAALITAEKNKDGSNTFVDFFTDADCAESHKLAAETVATEATTIYAKFTTETTPAEEFDVTFWDGDTQLTKIATQKVESGKFATKPAKDPVKTGYDFKGWFTTDELTTTFDFATMPITAATKIYAKFEAKTFKVTLNKNCTGDVTGLPTASNGFVGIEVTYGGKYTDLPTLTREGYDFLGWYTDPKNSTYRRKATDTVSITADATLYAHWEIKEVDLTFDWNDDVTDPTTNVFSVVYGTKAITVAPKATRTGYKFDGWYDSKDFENENTKKLNDKVIAKADATYYAKWTAIKYTVKFDANGGTSTTAMANQSREYGDGVKLTANSYTRDHYSFVNWNTKKDGSGVTIANEATADLSETDGATVTLYAQWDGEDVTVTYEYDYEKNAAEVVDEPVTVNYGDAYPAPDTDKLAGNPGFYFDGWYDKTDADKKIIDITKDKVQGNIVLKAKWTAVTYKATFNSNNSKKKTNTITLDATKTDPIAFTDVFEEADAAGQTFEGWATADNAYDSLSHATLIAELKGTKSATAKTVTGVVYAQWESTGKYNIELDPNLPTGALDSDLLIKVNTIESVNFAEPFFLTGEEFRLFGYTLTGWTYKNAKGKTVTVKPAAKLVSLTTSKDATVKVSAKWKKTTYTLKYNLNGGTAKKGTKTTVKFGVNEATRKGIPFLNYNESYNIDEAKNWVVTKRGYKFTGWGYAEGSAYYGKDHYWNMSLYAQWEPNKYTIKLDPETGKFDDDEGTDVRIVTTTATFQDSYVLGDDSTSVFKTGYTFKYWKATGANGKVKTYAANAYVNVKDLSPDEANGTVYTLKAVYAPKTNKINYILNGGTINKNAPKSYVTDGTSNKAILDPTKAGFTFNGWTVYNDDPDFGEVVANVLGDDKKIKAGISGPLYFVANWTVNTYTIEFYSNDGQTPFTAVTMPGMKYADTVDFTDTAIAIEGTTGFTGSVKGFAKAPGAKKAAYALNKTYSKLGAKTETGKTLKLYVVGQPQIHRISYELNGGTLKNALYEYKTPTAKAGLKLKTTATKKGFTFKGFTCDDENSVVTNANGYVTAIKQGAEADLVLVAVFDNEVSYSIVAMPNAGDVVDANGEVASKKGVQFQVDGERLFPISNSIPVNDLRDYLDWYRPGYDLAGFSTTKNGKKLIDTLGGLSYNKKKVATVYAIWTAETNYIRYEDRAEIYRGGTDPHHTEYLVDLGVKPLTYTTQKVGSKAITPKKLSAKGYTFKGWRVSDYNGDAADLKVVYADKAKKYVKSVAKNNAASYVQLTPVFEENYYNLYVNPNGGTYKGSKKKQLVGKVYYSEEVPVAEIISELSRSGYGVDGVSTTKNYKGYVSPYRTGLSAKNKGSVTVNALWYKTFVVKPTVSATISGTDMGIYFEYLSKADAKVYYEIQYSPSSSFTYNVQTITLEADAWEGDNLKPITRTVVEGKDYYLRARMFRKDSTGKYVSSAWSATARASRRGVATTAIQYFKVLDAKVDTKATVVNITKGSKVAAALTAKGMNAYEGYDFVGYFTDSSCAAEKALDADATDVTKVYAKFTAKPEVTVTSIAVKTAPTKTTYTAGENFDPTGLVITATLSDESTQDVAYASNESKFTFAPTLTTALTTEDTSVTITYGGKTATQAITVEAASVTVTGIAVKTAPTKVTYTAGEFFDPAGLVITVTKSDESSEDVAYNDTTKDDFTFSPALNEALATENNSVTITYGGQDATQAITVEAASATVTGIAVKTAPTKVTYTAGENFDPTGLVITVTKSDESSEDVTYASNESNFTFAPTLTTALTTEDTSVTITYGGKTATQDITVSAPVIITGITVKTAPTKVTYAEGDKFNPAGLVITVAKSNSTSEDVEYNDTTKGDFTFSPDLDTTLTTSNDKVTITYGGQTVDQGITVEAGT